MQDQALITRIGKQAEIFKSRAVKGHGDQKRHDLVQRDEQRAMSTAHNKLGWSFAKIGSTFNRDPRAVKQAVQSYEKMLREGSKARKQAPTEAAMEQAPYGEAPQQKTSREAPEVDPIQLAHLRDLRKFLQEDRIRNSFSVKPPGSEMEGILEQLVSGGSFVWLRRSGFPWEGLPIVSDIRSHCPEHQLWKDIAEWKRRENEYLGSTLDIARKLRAEFRGTLDFPGIKINDPALECHPLLHIFNWLAGQLLGNVSPPYYVRFLIHVIVQGKKVLMNNIPANDRVRYNGYKARIAWGDMCYAEGTVEQVERAREAAEDFLKRWSDSDDMRSLVRQYYSLEALADRIDDGIQHIDQAVLAQGSCPNCLIMRSNERREGGQSSVS